MRVFESNDVKHGWNSWNAPLRWPARVVGVVAALLVIGSGHSNNPVLELAGKGLFWSLAVLGSVFLLNRDLSRVPTAWIIAVCLTVVQIALVKMFWNELYQLNFIELTPIAFAQAIVFFLPFLLLRRRIGVEYHPESRH